MHNHLLSSASLFFFPHLFSSPTSFQFCLSLCPTANIDTELQGYGSEEDEEEEDEEEEDFDFAEQMVCRGDERRG